MHINEKILSHPLSIGEAAKMVGVSTATMRQRAREGKIPFIGGRMLRFKIQDINEAMNNAVFENRVGRISREG